MSNSFSVSGYITDILHRKIFPGIITISEGRIESVTETQNGVPDQYILPGFTDAHIHIESSMLAPSEFAQIAILHGTIATVSDPHEIANVCGIDGVDYMIQNAATVPFKFNFGAPSCVPATPFESAGAVISADDIHQLLSRKEILYLSEMMNFPGVLMKDEEVMKKIDAAKKHGKPVDGHAPGLKGEQALQYAQAGISTDHECTTLEEAIDKINAGMYILIREGSAAKNFDALIELLRIHPGKVMFCSDDKHPDELMYGHISQLVKRALNLGYELFDILHAACILPVLHYRLDVGILRKDDHADFIVVDNLTDFNLVESYINGVKVAAGDVCLFDTPTPSVINNFSAAKITPEQLKVTNIPPHTTKAKVRIIEALDGQLLTNASQDYLDIIDGDINIDLEKDILKIVVVNRYRQATPAVGFIRKFGLKKGAIASSVAHDSHNIVAIGTSNESLASAINAIIETKGGIAVFDGKDSHIMALPIAGLMAATDAAAAAKDYETLDRKAKELGSTLKAPFMSLSFMSLPVIPSIKMTDKGLFDVDVFDFADVVEKE